MSINGLGFDDNTWLEFEIITRIFDLTYEDLVRAVHSGRLKGRKAKDGVLLVQWGGIVEEWGYPGYNFRN